MTFDALSIDPRCLRVLRDRNISTPTPIQAQAIPIALTGADLVGIAQTGTGKTLAFGLPALTRIADMPRGKTRMLILTPTRELAVQIHQVLAPVATALNMATACVYGGVGMEPQAVALRRGTPIIVACPGRLLDHINRGNARFDGLSVLVLDEADRMLDMGFLPDIKRVLAALPAKRQTMMFSATFAPEVSALAANMMVDPQRIEIGAVAKPADAVTQRFINVARMDKLALLKHLLAQGDMGSTIVFMKMKHATDKLAKALDAAGYAADSLHGGQAQNRRQRAIDAFRAGRTRILVATDVAARGLDVKGISHVINYDMPTTPDDYIHRIGRTARASADGDAISFVTVDDREIMRDLERHLGRRVDREQYGDGGASEGPKPAAQRPQRYQGSHQRQHPRAGSGRAPEHRNAAQRDAHHAPDHTSHRAAPSKTADAGRTAQPRPSSTAPRRSGAVVVKKWG